MVPEALVGAYVSPLALLLDTHSQKLGSVSITCHIYEKTRHVGFYEYRDSSTDHAYDL